MTEKNDDIISVHPTNTEDGLDCTGTLESEISVFSVSEDAPFEQISENENEEASTDTDAELSESEKKIKELSDTVRLLRDRLSELEQMREAQSKILGELEDFSAFFPSVQVTTIPESVWESVKKGTPLAAAYALYERKKEMEREKISTINKENASRSAGNAGKNTASEYFSPDEVRKMSHAEVHANYSKIKESMKKWI